jgi:hypothetical protein
MKRAPAASTAQHLPFRGDLEKDPEPPRDGHDAGHRHLHRNPLRANGHDTLREAPELDRLIEADRDLDARQHVTERPQAAPAEAFVQAVHQPALQHSRRQSLDLDAVQLDAGGQDPAPGVDLEAVHASQELQVGESVLPVDVAHAPLKGHQALAAVQGDLRPLQADPELIADDRLDGEASLKQIAEELRLDPDREVVGGEEAVLVGGRDELAQPFRLAPEGGAFRAGPRPAPPARRQEREETEQGRARNRCEGGPDGRRCRFHGSRKWRETPDDPTVRRPFRRTGATPSS